jgi:hypothetical protein
MSHSGLGAGLRVGAAVSSQASSSYAQGGRPGRQAPGLGGLSLEFGSWPRLLRVRP